MKKIDFKILVITCIACLLPIILGLIFYNDLPDKVAIHFDVYGNPDNYFPKIVVVFLVPVFMMIVQAICCILSDLSDKNPEANKKAVGVFKWIIPILSILLYVVTLMYSMVGNIDMRKAAMIMLGLMLVVMGNYIPKTVGDVSMRFPRKEIKDKALERRAKKIAGYGCIINGVFCIISILFVPQVSVALVILFIIEALILAFCVWLKDKNSKQ